MKENQSSDTTASDSAPARPPMLIRGVIVVLALVAWFWTQALIGQRGFTLAPVVGEELTRGDALLMGLAPVHHYLSDHPAAANALLIVSSAVIDSLSIFLLAWGIFGPTIRPILGLIPLFALRQLAQVLCVLPAPAGMIWREPGFPSLLVTYSVANDLFFSGHTALAVYGAIELARSGRRWLIPLGVLIALFEIVTVLALRAHYTLDVYAGAITAVAMALLADRLAPTCDRALARLAWKKLG
ncbi:MAG: phosphatase PAP2-related protein [Gemmataceae bacterium]